MYFTKTKLASTVGATLLVAILLSTPAFATDAGAATLTNNERAAQSAIADSPTYDGCVKSESAEATLSSNEHSAQHAIVDAPTSSRFLDISRSSAELHPSTSDKPAAAR